MRDEPEIVKELREAEKSGMLQSVSSDGIPVFEPILSDDTKLQTTMHHLELEEALPSRPHKRPHKPTPPSLTPNVHLRLNHLRDANRFLREQLQVFRDEKNQFEHTQQHLKKALSTDHSILSDHLGAMLDLHESLQNLLTRQLSTSSPSDIDPFLFLHHTRQHLLAEQLHTYLCLRNGLSTCSQQQIDLCHFLTDMLEPYQLLFDHLNVSCQSANLKQSVHVNFESSHLKHILLHFLFSLIAIHQPPVDLSFSVISRRNDVLLQIKSQKTPSFDDTENAADIPKESSASTSIIQALLYANGCTCSQQHSLGRLTDVTVVIPLEPVHDLEGRFNKFFTL